MGFLRRCPALVYFLIAYVLLAGADLSFGAPTVPQAAYASDVGSSSTVSSNPALQTADHQLDAMRSGMFEASFLENGVVQGVAANIVSGAAVYVVTQVRIGNRRTLYETAAAGAAAFAQAAGEFATAARLQAGVLATAVNNWVPLGQGLQNVVELNEVVVANAQHTLKQAYTAEAASDALASLSRFKAHADGFGFWCADRTVYLAIRKEPTTPGVKDKLAEIGVKQGWHIIGAAGNYKWRPTRGSHKWCQKALKKTPGFPSTPRFPLPCHRLECIPHIMSTTEVAAAI